MEHIIKKRGYNVGDIVLTPDGFVQVEEYLGEQNGFPTYRVISQDIKFVHGKPTNTFTMQIVPLPRLRVPKLKEVE